MALVFAAERAIAGFEVPVRFSLTRCERAVSVHTENVAPSLPQSDGTRCGNRKAA
jgi:hypothetical protein